MICRFCETEVEMEQYECSNCGAILMSAPARLQQNRPQREIIAIVESSNYNGEYKLTKNPDGSYSCDCLSFLFQRGTRNGEYPFTTCKHIRDRVDTSIIRSFKFTPPSAWQKTCLKKMGVNLPDGLTNDQAYFIFSDLLERQGFGEYKEFKKFLLENPNPSFLPLKYFGVEFEGGLNCSREEFQNILSDAGIESIICGYDHTLLNKKWKLGSDSSVNVPNLNPVEVVSPKLYGATGFKEIERVLKLWNDSLPLRNHGTLVRIPGVNRTCGMHVHVDAHGWDFDSLLRLAKVWAKIEIPVIWYLVSPSRRGGNYCKRLDFQYLKALSERRMPENRYYSLNLQALHRQNSIEFRIHNGTLEANKAIPWIVFCLMLTDAVLYKGLNHRDFEPTFSGLMTAIGMDSNATPIIKEAKDFLWGRFLHWKEDAERNPSNAISAFPLDVDNLEAEIQRLARERRSMEIRSAFVSRRGLTRRNPDAPSNTVTNLASLIPSSVISAERYLMLGEGVWQVPSRDGQSSYNVSHDSASDTLTCNCRGFRTHGHCYHSINLARYIYTQRELEAVETEIAVGEVENV